MKKVTTLAASRRIRDARHLMRYLKAKARNGDLKAIAKEEGVSVETIRDSVRNIEAYETMNGDGQLKLAVNGLLMNLFPQTENTISGLLNATTITSVKNHKTGEMENVLVEDKTTRLEAGRLMKDLISVTQPKAPQVAIQNNQTNQVAQIGSAETYEERLDRLRKKAAEHNLLPAEVAAVPRSIDLGEEDDDEPGDDDEDDE